MEADSIGGKEEIIMGISQRILSKFKRSQPIMEEVAATQSRLASSAYRLAAYSPDDLLSRKGLAIYDEMQKDAQVRSCLNTKKFAVLSKGWDIIPADGSQANIRSANFVKFCFQDMKGSLQDVLFKVLDALSKGFSVCEINYKVIREGPFAGMIGLDSIKSKDPAAFGFEMDEFLNVRGLTIAEGGKTANLPVEKFIIYTYMPEYEMPHGQSDLRAAYKHWWSKEIILKFWNVYLEKFGLPTAKGSYRRGLPKEQQDDLLRVLDKIQQETAIVIPEDIRIELIEAQRGGEAGYLAAIEYHNKQIAKAILGQTLTTEEGSRVGSLALAKVHLNVLYFYLQKLKRDLEETVMQEQVIRRLIDINFGPSENGYPKLVLGSLEDKDIEALGGLVEKLIAGKVVAPNEPWIREYLGIPV
ncbi:MAG: DUF935 family protein, partial [Armatimonadota bacterium]|nr:DUF935 family protein [Armatimonadota bacterium]